MAIALYRDDGAPTVAASSSAFWANLQLRGDRLLRLKRAGRLFQRWQTIGLKHKRPVAKFSPYRESGLTAEEKHVQYSQRQAVEVSQEGA